jgi:SAM-dependent methyltransferase
MNQEPLCSRPTMVSNPSDCWFYHTIDLPGYGTMVGEWDLRDRVDHYLGGVSLTGKRVLEVGTASGFLCFAMEKQGAEVVAVDLPVVQPIDFIPRAQPGIIESYLPQTLQGLERVRNSFWLSHRALGSRARLVSQSVYDLPAEIGLVDVCTFGCVLLHLRDPFLALANALRLTRETVIITEMMHPHPAEGTIMGVNNHRFERLKRAIKTFIKRLLGLPASPPLAGPHMIPCMLMLNEFYEGNMTAWWYMTPALVHQFLAILGFEEIEVSYHEQMFKGKPANMYTVVGHRTQPLPKRIDGPYPWY